MSDTDRAWLILANAFVTAREYAGLVERFGPATKIVQQSASELRDAGLGQAKCDAVTSPDSELVQRGLAWLGDDTHHLIHCDSDTMPVLLRQIAAPPLLLYVNGNPECLHLPALAIVGSRNPTQAGIRNSGGFAGHLGAAGFTIVSGLAQGIDTAAHRGALQAEAYTVAVLGHGIDRVYPACNRDLAHEIAAAGALVSEYPLGTAPARQHFPERNRIISGLSFGTLVVEAARRSGSLITARLSAEQGREVFALPGSIHNPLARGCHQLLRDGAKLVETAADIVAELAPVTGHVMQNSMESTSTATTPEVADEHYPILRKYLGHDPVTVDVLADQSGLTIEQVSSMLLILELHGEVESLSGGRYSLLN